MFFVLRVRSDILAILVGSLIYRFVTVISKPAYFIQAYMTNFDNNYVNQLFLDTIIHFCCFNLYLEL
jgi:hypothetical protein